ncbi:hypothetical protein JMUB6875_67180 [Nocardia sp. JMUB6875]
MRLRSGGENPPRIRCRAGIHAIGRHCGSGFGIGSGGVGYGNGSGGSGTGGPGDGIGDGGCGDGTGSDGRVGGCGSGGSTGGTEAVTSCACFIQTLQFSFSDGELPRQPPH